MGRVIHPESDPLRVVIDSIQACLAAGYDVRPTGPLGVMVVDPYAEQPWGPDLAAGGATTVLGAVILCEQPRPVGTIEQALMIAFNASLTFAWGVKDALQGYLDEDRFAGWRSEAVFYWAGWQVGHAAVVELRGSGPALDINDENLETPQC